MHPYSHSPEKVTHLKLFLDDDEKNQSQQAWILSVFLHFKPAEQLS
jgi:hypothetical protein